MADTLTIRSIDPVLKGKIAQRAERRQLNMNALLISILAEHYGIEYEPGGRKRTVGASPQIVLELPDELKQAIKEDAQDSDETQRNVAMRIICRSFNFKFVATGRWLEGSATAA